MVKLSRDPLVPSSLSTGGPVPLGLDKVLNWEAKGEEKQQIQLDPDTLGFWLLPTLTLARDTGKHWGPSPELN